MSNGREGEKPKAPTYTPGGLLDDGLFFEQVEGGQYVMWDWKGTQLFKENYVTDTADKVYMPLDRVPWPLCKEPLDYNMDTLWQDIRDFIHDHLYLPDKKLYDVLTAWIVASWTPELWSVVPYLFFHGAVSTGKTRGLEVVQRLCYRGMMASNMSSAVVYRACDMYRPTLILDETEIYNHKDRGDIIGLLNAGYRRGQYAFRINKDKGMLLEAFDAFGQKALAGTQGLRATLESRCILIRMIKARRKVRLFVDEDRAHTIRCKLLMYRMRTLRFEASKESVGQTVKSELGERCEHFLARVPKLNFADGRLQELFQCLLAVANHGQKNILEYAEKMAENRLSEEMAGVEAELVTILSSPDLDMANGVVLTKTLTSKFNEGRDERERWKSNSIGYLMKRLGFVKKHTNQGNGWRINQSLLQMLQENYSGGKVEDAKPFSVAEKGSQSSQCSPDTTLVTARPNATSLTLQEIIQKVRPQLTSSFEVDKLSQKIIGLGFSKEQAQKHVDFLISKELIGRDDVGMWHWTPQR